MMFRCGSKLDKETLQILLSNHTKAHEIVLENILLNEQSFAWDFQFPEIVEIIYSYILPTAEYHQAFDESYYFHRHFGVYDLCNDLEKTIYVTKNKFLKTVI